MKNQHTNKHQGSVILAALIVILIVGVLTTSYMQMSVANFRQSSRAFHYNSLLNLIEGGAERAIWTKYNDGDTWTGWQYDGDRAYRHFENVDLGNGKSGEVFVYVTDLISSDPSSLPKPKFRVESRIDDPLLGTYWRQVQLELTNRSLLFSGLSAKDVITTSGVNVNADSYNSNNGAYDTTTNRNDQITIGTISTTDGALTFNEVYGYAASGGGTIEVNKIYGVDSTSTYDTSRMSYDFYADYPDAEKPTLSSPITSISGLTSLTTVLSGGGGGGIFFAGQSLSLLSLDARSETSGHSTTYTIGTGGTADNPIQYHVDGFTVRSQDILEVDGNAILVLEGDMSMNGTLHITEGSSLVIYSADNIKIAGNGVLNDNNVPLSLFVVGTAGAGDGQQIDIKGNGVLSAVVYAPNAALTEDGGGNSGEIFGAAIANNIKFVGNSSFHYDEALGEFDYGGGGYKLDGWLEVTQAKDRMDFDSFVF